MECDRFLVVLRQPIRETAAPTRGDRQPDRAPGMNESDARTDVDDRALLQRMAQGDRAALAPLYHGYHGRLCRFLSRLTRCQAIIEEVVHDCVWIARRNAGSLRRESTVPAGLEGSASDE